MYKGKSESMQRGTHHRDREVVDLKALYGKRPPTLTKAEKAHFDFGSNDLSTFIERVSPTVRTLSKGKVRKPAEVSHALNKMQIRTAAGGTWNARLAWFLLSFVFEGQVPRQTEQAGRLLKVTNRPPKPPDIHPIATPGIRSYRRSSPLTKEEIAGRLAVLGRVKSSRADH
jgi:hypothetical protein